jgi:hypothetical protein
VTQGSTVPAQHPNPLSHVVSQSSSIPLHDSAGVMHVPGVQLAEQTVEPVLPQPVVQGTTASAQHPKPLSQTVSQSSSNPLHVSAGPRHAVAAGGLQLSSHSPVPGVPHAVVHAITMPAAHGKPSSTARSQSSSKPLHSSGAPTSQPTSSARPSSRPSTSVRTSPSRPSTSGTHTPR